MTKIVAYYGVTLNVPKGVSPEEYATEWGKSQFDWQIDMGNNGPSNLGWWLDDVCDTGEETREYPKSDFGQDAAKGDALGWMGDTEEQ